MPFQHLLHRQSTQLASQVMLFTMLSEAMTKKYGWSKKVPMHSIKFWLTGSMISVIVISLKMDSTWLLPLLWQMLRLLC